MVVRFTTDNGVHYSIDHSKSSFFRDAGNTREGELWNVPQVRKGHRVVIFTEPSGPEVVRVIHTGIVVDRTVEF